MASKNFVVKHGITVGGVEVIDATGQITSQALVSAVIPGPTKTSDLTNDSGFITNTALNGYALTSAIPTNTNQLTNGSGFITTSALSGYALTSAIPTKTSNLTNDSGFITTSALSGYALTSSIPSLTGYALTSAIPTNNNQLSNGAGFITASALSGYALTSAIPTNTNQLTNGAGFITSSALSGYALTSAIPSLTSYATQTYVNTAVSNLVNAAPTTLDTLKEIATALGNDANFSSTITTLIGTKASTSSLSTVAFTGSYTDLVSKPVTYSTGSSAPSSPNAGDRWLHADTGIEYTYIVDDDSSQWVETTAASLYNTNYDFMLNKPTLATVATSGSYADLINTPPLFSGRYGDLSNKPTLFSGNYNDLVGKPLISIVGATGSYNDLLNKPTIPSLPSQTGNAGKVLSTNGSTLSWITAASGGGGGGSVDLSQVSQDITPNVTGTHSVGTDLAVWGSVNSKYVKVNSVETIIGTVVNKTVVSEPIPVTLPSFYTSPVMVAGINWPGFYYVNPYNVTSDIVFDEIAQDWFATTASGIMSFAFYGLVDASAIFSGFLGTTIQITNQYAITLTVQVTGVTTTMSGAEITFVTYDPNTATIIGKAFVVYVQGYDTFAPSVSGLYIKYTTLIEVSDPPVTLIAASDYPADNGEPFYYVGVTDNSIEVPGFQVVSISVQPYPIWFYPPFHWGFNIQTSDPSTLITDRAVISKLSVGDAVYLEYTSTATGNIEHAKFTIATPVYTIDYGPGIWAFSIEALLVETDNPNLLDPSTNALDYFTTNVMPTGITVKFDVPIDVSGLYIVSPLVYGIDKSTYPFFDVGSTIGYYSAPKLTLTSSHHKIGGIDIQYNPKTKQTSIGGFTPAIVVYSNTTGGNALVSYNSLLPDSNSADISNGIAIGNYAALSASSVSIGYSANNNWRGVGSVAIGANAQTVSNATSIGASSTASGDGSLALGTNTNSNSYGSIAIGYGAVSQGNYATAIGPSQAFIRSSLAYGGTNYSNYRNQSVKFQLHGHSPTATSYLSETGTTYSTQSAAAGIMVYNLFAQGGGGAGLIYGTARFMIRAEGTLNPVSAFIWKIVEIKFSLYAHKWSGSGSLSFNTTGNYEFTTISTTTIATSAAAGHAAWTPSLQFGYSVESPSSAVFLWAKVAKTDSLAITATAKFEIEVLNSATN